MGILLAWGRHARRGGVIGAVVGVTLSTAFIAVDPPGSLLAVSISIIVIAAIGAFAGALAALVLVGLDRLMDRWIPEPATEEERAVWLEKSRRLAEHYAEAVFLTILASALLWFTASAGDFAGLIRGEVTDQPALALITAALGVTTASRAVAAFASGLAGHLREDIAQANARPPALKD